MTTLIWICIIFCAVIILTLAVSEPSPEASGGAVRRLPRTANRGGN